MVPRGCCKYATLVDIPLCRMKIPPSYGVCPVQHSDWARQARWLRWNRSRRRSFVLQVAAASLMRWLDVAAWSGKTVADWAHLRCAGALISGGLQFEIMGYS